MTRDALVIGAGPAGSITARELARRGRAQWLCATLEVVLSLLLTPRDLFIYQAAMGLVVSALWGYAAPSLLRRVWALLPAGAARS